MRSAWRGHGSRFYEDMRTRREGGVDFKRTESSASALTCSDTTEAFAARYCAVILAQYRCGLLHAFCVLRCHQSEEGSYSQSSSHHSLGNKEPILASQKLEFRLHNPFLLWSLHFFPFPSKNGNSHAERCRLSAPQPVARARPRKLHQPEVPGISLQAQAREGDPRNRHANSRHRIRLLPWLLLQDVHARKVRQPRATEVGLDRQVWPMSRSELPLSVIHRRDDQATSRRAAEEGVQWILAKRESEMQAEQGRPM
jgi:hypothetical protein